MPKCRTPDCPWPTNEEVHIPWCRAIAGHVCFGGATHDHGIKRSQGGKRIDAILCAGLHDAVDNGLKFEGRRWGKAIVEHPGGPYVGERYYRLFDRDFDHTPEGHDLLFRSIPPDEHGNEKVRVELAPAMQSDVDEHRGVGVGILPEPASDGHRVETDGWNDWLEQGAMLGGTERNIPWAVGDWVVWGEERFGEEAAQGYDTLGLTLGAINQRAWVAKQYPPLTRVKGCSWSMHRAALRIENDEERRYALLDAATRSLSVAAFLAEHGLVKPPPVYRCPDCGREGLAKEFRP